MTDVYLTQRFSGDQTAGDARHLPGEEEVYDLDAGRDPSPVERLLFNLRLFTDAEPTDGYETLPLARLLRTGNPARPVEVDAAFSPPVAD